MEGSPTGRLVCGREQRVIQFLEQRGEPDHPAQTALAQIAIQPLSADE